jgi:hypothetical protein
VSASILLTSFRPLHGGSSPRFRLPWWLLHKGAPSGGVKTIW